MKQKIFVSSGAIITTLMFAVFVSNPILASTSVDEIKIDMSNVDLSKIDWSDVDFSKINWDEMNQQKNQLPDVDLNSINFDQIKWSEIKGINHDLSKIDWSEIDLSEINLKEIEFSQEEWNLLNSAEANPTKIDRHEVNLLVLNNEKNEEWIDHINADFFFPLAYALSWEDIIFYLILKLLEEIFGKSKDKDPIVIGKWSYIEPGNDHKCSNSPNPFDYDNDGFKEHMCYWYSPETKILFVDFNSNKQLDNGYELLNSNGYENALEILEISPELCNNSDCYVWQDKNSNIRVDDNELKQFKQTFKLSGIMKYDDGKLSNDVYLPEGRERGYFIYGEADDEHLGKLYATKPTYWMIGSK